MKQIIERLKARRDRMKLQKDLTPYTITRVHELEFVIRELELEVSNSLVYQIENCQDLDKSVLS